MKLDFSLGTGRAMTFEEIAEESRLAEELGFKQLTLVDQPDLDREVYLMMAVAALNTSRIKIGHGVTVPGFRHPSIQANSMACVNELSKGRAFYGVGTGWIVYGTKSGTPIAPLQELRDVVQFIRQYMTGEDAVWEGATQHSEWIRRPVPMYVAANGPKALQAAGEIADGVIIPGVNVEVMKWRLEHVARGAERAGRDLRDIDVWARTMIIVADSREAARREASAYGIMTMWHTLHLKGPDGDELRRRLRKTIPDLDDFAAETARVHQAFDIYKHEQLDSPHSKMVTQRMVDLLSLTGTPDDINERIERLGELGVNNISPVVFTAKNRKQAMRNIAAEVMPKFQS